MQDTRSLSFTLQLGIAYGHNKIEAFNMRFIEASGLKIFEETAEGEMFSMVGTAIALDLAASLLAATLHQAKHTNYLNLGSREALIRDFLIRMTNIQGEKFEIETASSITDN